MELETLLIQDAGGVRTVTLNRPDRRNAMSLEMVRELRGVLADSESNSHCRILVLRGSQGHFCSGGDVADMAEARARTTEGDDDPIAELSSQFGRLCLAYSHTKLALV